MRQVIVAMILVIVGIALVTAFFDATPESRDKTLLEIGIPLGFVGILILVFRRFISK